MREPAAQQDGTDYLIGQIVKKALEARRLTGDAKLNELRSLGGNVLTALAVIRERAAEE
jgi:hypothetical protein